MNISEMRTYVRDYIDLDSTDLPDSLIDVWLTEGYHRIQDHHHQWPWRLVERSRRDTATGIVEISNWQMIHDVRLDDRTLIELPHATALQRWPAHLNTTSDKPNHYSIYNSELFIWPRPSTTIALFIRGVDTAPAWTPSTTPTPPDIPSRLVPLIARWALAAAYEREGDLRTATELRASFLDELERYRQRVVFASGNEFVALGDGAGDAVTLTRLRYPWE